MDSNGSQFSIVWPDYQKKISDGYTCFQQHEEFVDMTLAADGHYVKVHQFIVALASPYLKEIIKSIPSKHPVIFLHNVSYSELCQILEYIYTGEVNVPHDALNNFIKSGKALKLEGISSLSANMSESNSTLDKPFEEPLATSGATEETDGKIKDTMTTQSYVDDLLSELEQTMSIVKDTQEEIDFEEIIQVQHITSKPRSSIIKMDTDNVEFVSSESQEKVNDNIGKLKILEIESMHDNNDFAISYGNRGHKSMEQNQELTKSSNSIMSSKTIKSGKIRDIGQKTIVVSKRAEKRKSEHLSSRQHKTSKTSLAENTLSIPSIVIENNPDGHLITINQPVSAQDNAEIVTLPSLDQTSISELVHSSFAASTAQTQIPKPTHSQSTAVISSFSMPEKLNTGMIDLTAPSFNMETECSVEPSTSAPSALGPNDLINLNPEERKNLTAELKGGTPQLYTISNKGTLQMIFNRYMYNPHYAAYGGRKRRWRCVDYRKQQCKAYLDTDGEAIVKRVNPHSHAFHDKRIMEKLEKEAVFSSIANANENKIAGPQTVSSENID